MSAGKGFITDNYQRAPCNLPKQHCGGPAGVPVYHPAMRPNQPTQILVVDDDPDLRDLLREYLTQQGFEVRR